MPSVREQIYVCLQDAILEAFPQCADIKFSLEPCVKREYGDFCTPLAFIIQKRVGTDVVDVAEKIVSALKEADFFHTDIVNGFINMKVKPERVQKVIEDVWEQKDGFGAQDIGKGKKVLIEFVSANPTGPLHIGHGRAAALGDALARILSFLGFDVTKEYYINNVGAQIEKLGESVRARYLSLFQDASFPENGYKGDYIEKIAHTLYRIGARSYKEQDKSFFARFAQRRIMEEIKKCLNRFGVRFHSFVRESNLHKDGRVEKAVEKLEEGGFVYQKDGAKWFSAMRFGDEKDRVLVREDGFPTYFCADIAYHAQKCERGYEMLIDVWGHDHHGYKKRIEAAMAALGYMEKELHIILYQFVNLKRGEETVSMSTRDATYIELEKVMDEVGEDATKFTLLSKACNTPIDFDIEEVKKKQLDNPLYYIQYAHARINSLLEEGRKQGVCPDNSSLHLLHLPEERQLALKLDEFQDQLLWCAKNLDVYRVANYLVELATLFHNYYSAHRIIVEEKSVAAARLMLCWCIKCVIHNGAGLLGVTCPQRM